MRILQQIAVILVCFAPVLYAAGEVSQPAGVLIPTTPRQGLGEGRYYRFKRELRGWEYLASRLVEDGVSPQDVESIYASSNMPGFSYVYFSLAPKESADIYSGFRSESKAKLLRRYMTRNLPAFAAAERELKVPREVVGAILLVETHCGQVTGTNRLIYRLSRLASVGKPENLRVNFERLQESDPAVTFAEVTERAHYLEQTFYPEIAALIKIAQRRKVNIFNIRGSQSGAFGIPQFLPTSYLRYGADGNGDGIISLYSAEDAIWSAANYLSGFGWDNSRSVAENRDVLWRYNKSDAYIDTVISIAERIRE